jgi:hypothetical protein
MAGPMPRIFYFKSCYGVAASGAINVGLSGVKPFTTWFDVENGSGFQIAFRLHNNQPDTGCLPTNVFKFTGTVENFDSSGTYWAYDRNAVRHGGGGADITWANDSGNPTSHVNAYDRRPAMLPLSSVSTTSSLPVTARFVAADATAGAITLTLPAASVVAQRVIVVQKVDSSGNAVTLDGNGAETINGSATIALASRYDTVQLYSSGLGWTVIAAAGTDVAYP